jgi:hypothetical protein
MSRRLNNAVEGMRAEGVLLTMDLILGNSQADDRAREPEISDGSPRKRSR